MLDLPIYLDNHSLKPYVWSLLDFPNDIRFHNIRPERLITFQHSRNDIVYSKCNSDNHLKHLKAIIPSNKNAKLNNKHKSVKIYLKWACCIATSDLFHETAIGKLARHFSIFWTCYDCFDSDTLVGASIEECNLNSFKDIIWITLYKYTLFNMEWHIPNMKFFHRG